MAGVFFCLSLSFKGRIILPRTLWAAADVHMTHWKKGLSLNRQQAIDHIKITLFFSSKMATEAGAGRWTKTRVQLRLYHTSTPSPHGLECKKKVVWSENLQKGYKIGGFFFDKIFREKNQKKLAGVLSGFCAKRPLQKKLSARELCHFFGSSVSEAQLWPLSCPFVSAAGCRS